jgi:hypothetical protein
MDLAQKIESRRFFGRELLLHVWFETEVFEGTLSVKPFGSFGCYMERTLLLSAGKETTQIKGALPGQAREAKEALRRGKLPDRAGLHVILGEREASLTLKAETLGLSGLALPVVLTVEREVGEDAPERAVVKKRRMNASVAEEEEREEDGRAEAFYERMHLAREVEVLVEALYKDFLTLRLGPAWAKTVVPALRTWVRGEELDVEAYRRARTRALA